MNSIENLFASHPMLSTIADKAFRVLVIIAVVVICAKLIHFICQRILVEAKKASKATNGHAAERDKRVATVVNLVDTSLRVVFFGAALLMVLRECGLDITPLLTGAGIAGVALGFGAQSLVKDMISGFFLLIEDQIRVGDVIKVNSGLSGSVERMELRVTAIRDGDGTLHIIPNGEIKSVSNMTYDFAQAVVELPVPYTTDLKKLKAALSDVAAGLDADPKFKTLFRGRPEFLGITKFDAAHMVVVLTVKTEPHARWSVDREIRARIKLATEAAGIELITNKSPARPTGA